MDSFPKADLSMLDRRSASLGNTDQPSSPFSRSSSRRLPFQKTSADFQLSKVATRRDGDEISQILGSTHEEPNRLSMTHGKGAARRRSQADNPMQILARDNTGALPLSSFRNSSDDEDEDLDEIEPSTTRRRLIDRLLRASVAPMRPLPGRLENCGRCGKRFAVTSYNRTGARHRLMCKPCRQREKTLKERAKSTSQPPSQNSHPSEAGQWRCSSDGCAYPNLSTMTICLRCGANRLLFVRGSDPRAGFVAELIPAISSDLQNTATSNEQENQLCSMFMHYTISEDRCGDDATIKSGILAVLGSRSEAGFCFKREVVDCYESEILEIGESAMTCNKIWARLQSMEKFRNGEIDIDDLCSELRAKAKCSERGAVVDTKDVDKILGDLTSKSTMAVDRITQPYPYKDTTVALLHPRFASLNSLETNANLDTSVNADSWEFFNFESFLDMDTDSLSRFCLQYTKALVDEDFSAKTNRNLRARNLPIPDLPHPKYRPEFPRTFMKTSMCSPRSW